MELVLCKGKSLNFCSKDTILQLRFCPLTFMRVGHRFLLCVKFMTVAVLLKTNTKNEMKVQEQCWLTALFPHVALQFRVHCFSQASQNYILIVELLMFTFMF